MKHETQITNKEGCVLVVRNGDWICSFDGQWLSVDSHNLNDFCFESAGGTVINFISVQHVCRPL